MVLPVNVTATVNGIITQGIVVVVVAADDTTTTHRAAEPRCQCWVWRLLLGLILIGC